MRDREAGLRRQLMEHQSGVMAWEVRRLEQASTEARNRAEKAMQEVSAVKAREGEIMSRLAALQENLAQRDARNQELESIVLEMGRRERALEEDLRGLGERHRGLEQERSTWQVGLGDLDKHRSAWDAERATFEQQRREWEKEKQMLLQDRENVVKARALDKQRAAMSDRDRATVERVRVGLVGILGRQGVGEDEMVDAVEEVRILLAKREDEIVKLKDEMREVNMGLEEELRRVSADRDAWKVKAEATEQNHGARGADLERQIRVSSGSFRHP